jgi:hypothetical protein
MTIDTSSWTKARCLCLLLSISFFFFFFPVLLWLHAYDLRAAEYSITLFRILIFF